MEMKRQIFTLLMVFALALVGAAVMAQTPTNTPPDQKVDQSGQPETGPGPDVDVDVGKNAAGAVDVDVNRHTDADTAASGVDETPGADTNMKGANANPDDNANLPATGSELPLIGLVGLLALAGTVTVRSLR
jgi:hypothetical protein